MSSDRPIEVAGRTDVGRTRKKNEDGFLVMRLSGDVQDASFAKGEDGARVEGPVVVAVADGMGGHGGGDVASRVVLESLSRSIAEAAEGFEAAVPVFVHRAQADLDAAAEDAPEHPAMGTTLTVLCIESTVATLAHIGDSRAYILRDGTLTQLTEDHTLAEQLRRELDGEEAAGPESPMHHILYNALQAHADRQVDVDLTELPLQSGDVLMLCSDGLTKELSDAEISEILASSNTSAQAAQKLVDDARDRAGTDNITVVVARV